MIVTRRLKLLAMSRDNKEGNGNSTGRFGERSLDGIPFKSSEKKASEESAILQFDPLKFPERADSGLQPQAQMKPVKELTATEKEERYQYVDSQYDSQVDGHFESQYESLDNDNNVTLSP